MIKNILSKLVIMLLIIASSNILEGAEAGKIAGKVIDEQTGEALIGVNIMVVGTSLGAATDLNGEYFIHNLPAGVYKISASFIGYTKVTVENIVINAGRTTAINLSLNSSAIEQAEVVVTASRPPVEIDRTSSEQIIGSEEITKTFARTIPAILETQAGIWNGLFRGSSQVQTTYILDNMNLNSGIFSDNYTGINMSTIQEISVQTGGYNAEFGNARSAIVNVVTKGDVFYTDEANYNGKLFSDIHGTFVSRVRPAGKYHFGRNMFSTENYEWTNFNLDYWRSESENPDGQFYGQNPEDLLRDWHKQITANDTLANYADRIQHETEISVYGKISNNMGFLLSGRFKRGVSIFPQAIPYNDEYNFQGKFTYAFSPTTKITASGLVGKWEAVSAPSSNVVSYENSQETDWNGNMDVTDPYQWDKYAILGAPWHYWPEQRTFNQFNINFSNAISNKTFYEVTLGYLQDKSDKSDNYDAVRADKYDDTDSEYMMVDYFMKRGNSHNYDKYDSKVYSLKADLTSQITNEFGVKTGVEFKYYDMDFTHFMMAYEGGERWNLVNTFAGKPYEGNAFAQTKLEFEGMVINAGLRLDFFNQNREAPENIYDPLAYELTTDGHDPNDDQGIPGNPIMVATKLQTAISPRIGISHPLSENTVIHFFYGHFYQRPSFSKMLGFPFINFTENMGTALDPYAKQYTAMDQWHGYFGNPYMSYERTIQYEIGFDQNIANLFLLKVAAYYKDATDEANSWTRLYSATNQYNTPIMVSNSNYADVRGIEISLNSKFDYPINFGITDELYWSWLGDVGYSDMFEPISGQTNNPKGLVNEKAAWSDFNKIKGYVDIYFNKSYGNILGDFRIYAYTWWRQGVPYTYHGPGDISTKPNNQRWFSYYQTNLKISKGFQLLGTRAEISLDITNVFNDKFLNLLWGDDLRTWHENSNKPDEERLPKHWYSNEPNEWAWYSYEVPPRQFNIQFRLDF